MNIVIYTSARTGAIDSLNISQLLKERPQHTYSFVIVKETKNVAWWSQLKTVLIQFRDGKNHLKRDLKRLKKRLVKSTPQINFSNYSTFYVDEVNDALSEKTIKRLEPDIILQAGAGILKKHVFSLARKATINVHHGVAPEIRGVASTFWCLAYGLTDLIGVTCHIIDETLDTGSVVTQYSYDYTIGDSFLKIQEDICINGAKILVEAIDMFNKNLAFDEESEEVLSYYFSNVYYPTYNELKRNNFLPIKSDEAHLLKRKNKLKTQLKIRQIPSEN